MTLQRYLSDREILTLGNGERLELEYTGEIDEKVLSRAVELLGNQYPLLRARTRTHHDDRVQIYVPDEAKSRLEVIPAERNDHESARQLFIDRPWEPQTGVTKFALIRGSGRGYVIMRVDHSVTDGQLVMLYLREMWRIYTAIIENGHAPSIRSPKSLPKTFEDVVKKHFSSWRFVGKFPTLKEMHPGGRRFKPRIRNIVLNEQDTFDLRKYARLRNTSVHGLLCGAVMAAQRDWVSRRYPETPEGAFPMVCVSPVDLRKRADRTFDAENVNKLTVLHRATIEVAARSDPLEVGKNVADSIRSSVERKELQFGMPNPHEILSTAPEVAKSAEIYPEPLLLMASVSNIGAIAKFDLPDGLNVQMTRGAFNVVYDLPCYGSWTAGGRLVFIGGFAKEVFSDETADGIMDIIGANMRRFGISSATVSA